MPLDPHDRNLYPMIHRYLLTVEEQGDIAHSLDACAAHGWPCSYEGGSKFEVELLSAREATKWRTVTTISSSPVIVPLSRIERS
tara:strand:- start:261 stop:512 length:252 start_codon:yes stop_codon:yes gene_type:complete